MPFYELEKIEIHYKHFFLIFRKILSKKNTIYTLEQSISSSKKLNSLFINKYAKQFYRELLFCCYNNKCLWGSLFMFLCFKNKLLRFFSDLKVTNCLLLLRSLSSYVNCDILNKQLSTTKIVNFWIEILRSLQLT